MNLGSELLKIWPINKIKLKDCIIYFLSVYQVKIMKSSVSSYIF